MRTEEQINWEVLRSIVERDITTYSRIRGDESHNWLPATVDRIDAKIDAFKDVLYSMATLEFGTEVTLALIAADETATAAVLAEHTAAAQEKIIEASR